MSAKGLFPGGLILALVICCPAYGQYPSLPKDGAATQSARVPAESPLSLATVLGPVDHPEVVVSHDGPNCHGPIGGHGPVLFEAYLRNGVSLPFGGGPLARALDPGWDVQGGLRSLFLNPSLDAAWTVDVSVSNIESQASMHSPVFLNLLRPDANGDNVVTPVPITVHHYNRTFVNLAGGREWYLSGPADSSAGNWRAGFDIGGRWGTSKLDTNELVSKTDAITGVFVAVHSDIEFPCKCCLLYAGVRAEWSYTFCNILQSQNDADVQEANLMFTLGVRF
jgi:hypothetical protein